MNCHLARITLRSGENVCIPVSIQEETWGFTAVLKNDQLPADTACIDMLPETFTAKAGDEGYLVIPGIAADGTLLSYFTERADAEYAPEFSHMACFGIRRNGKARLAIVTSGVPYFTAVAGVQAGRYYAYARFALLEGEHIPGDIIIEYHDVPEGDYSAMARLYREYKLTRGGCVPLSERVKADARLQAAADVPEIRIRQGWKPVPSPVEYQTPETEPPMTVACTFDRVGDVIDEMKRQGLQGGEICLVGWNIGGHDGRFPQNFPADPRLGGDEGLAKLIDKADAAGLNIVCHTSSTAAYTIADCWDEEYIVKKPDGSLLLRPYCWGGGRPHKICPQRQFERFESKDIPRLAEVGFHGIHYIDVMSILPLVSCFDEKHPLDREGTVHWYRKVMDICRREIGGFGSEGAYDFAADMLDYTLYASFHVMDRKWNPLFDEAIPFWQLVYHGIILYNACTDTLNYAIKSPANRLKFFEYGGRPLAVFYANFSSGDNWMGREDLLCNDDEQLRSSVTKMKVQYDDYETLKGIRYCFMDRHEKIGDQQYRTTYSNGTAVEVDYTTNQAWLIENGQRRAL